eukprot:gene11716-2131_t
MQDNCGNQSDTSSDDMHDVSPTNQDFDMDDDNASSSSSISEHSSHEDGDPNSGMREPKY